MKTLELSFMPHENGYMVKVVKQSHRYLQFGHNDFTFQASNGMRLISLASPIGDLARVPKKFWVRGQVQVKDKDGVFVASEEALIDIKGAVAEYNRVFSDKPQKVEPPPIPVEVLQSQDFHQPEAVIDPPLEGETKKIVVSYATNYEFQYPGYSVVVSPLGVVIQK